MTAVVDASALVAALIGIDPDHAWADGALSGQPVAAPEIVLPETANILRGLELTGRSDPYDVHNAFASLMRIEAQLFPFTPFADRVWELRHNLTSYDAWYVALAEWLDCPLVTLDQRLSRSPGPTCEFITPTA